mmetsp:Transcript_27534/g.56466  ORF Transcript_27534/g.56466 Transcript_27534/m.56466 type:complete len:170 (-) Transcript_27534:10-519(-)
MSRYEEEDVDEIISNDDGEAASLGDDYEDDDYESQKEADALTSSANDYEDDNFDQAPENPQQEAQEDDYGDDYEDDIADVDGGDNDDYSAVDDGEISPPVTQTKQSRPLTHDDKENSAPASGLRAGTAVDGGQADEGDDDDYADDFLDSPTLKVEKTHVEASAGVLGGG